jgi:hypothetical protein
VLDVIRGRSYEEALMLVEYMPYRACEKIVKVLMSVRGGAGARAGLPSPAQGWSRALEGERTRTAAEGAAARSSSKPAGCRRAQPHGCCGGGDQQALASRRILTVAIMRAQAEQASSRHPLLG